MSINGLRASDLHADVDGGWQTHRAIEGEEKNGGRRLRAARTELVRCRTEETRNQTENTGRFKATIFSVRCVELVRSLYLIGYFLTLFSILLIGDFFFSFPTNGSVSIEPLLLDREDLIFDTHPRFSFFGLFSLSKLS